MEAHAVLDAQLVAQPLEPRPLGALAADVARAGHPAAPSRAQPSEQEVDR